MINEIAYYQSLTMKLKECLFINQIDHPSIRRFTTTYLLASGRSLDRVLLPLKTIARFYYHQDNSLSTLEKASQAKNAMYNWLSIDPGSLAQFFEENMGYFSDNKTALNLLTNIKLELDHLVSIENFPFIIEKKGRIDELLDTQTNQGLYPAIVLQRMKVVFQEGNPQRIINWLSAFESWLKDLPNYLLNPFNLAFGNHHIHQLNHHPNNLEVILNLAIQEGPLKAYRLSIKAESIRTLLTLTRYQHNKYSENEFRIFLFIAAYYKLMRQRDSTSPKLLIMPQVDLCAWLGNQKIFENTKPDAKGQGNDPLWYFTNTTITGMGPIIIKMNFYPEKTHYGFQEFITKHLILEEVVNQNHEEINGQDGIVYFNPVYDDFDSECVSPTMPIPKKSKNTLKNSLNAIIKNIGKSVKNN